MDGTQIIVALAASSGKQARDRYWEGILDGVALVIDKAAEEGRLSDEWISEVRDFIALAKEHGE